MTSVSQANIYGYTFVCLFSDYILLQVMRVLGPDGARQGQNCQMVQEKWEAELCNILLGENENQVQTKDSP